MKKCKLKLMTMLFISLSVITTAQINSRTDCDSLAAINSHNEVNGGTIKSVPKLTVKYTPMGVPKINSSFKTWMDYNRVSDKKSPQYKFIDAYGWSDAEGFMRASGEPDLGVKQDYYMIALGSYYGTTIGTKYRITLDTGRVFYGVLSECKADVHTNSTNQYITHNNNIVEFVVDETKLNGLVKQRGSANVYMPLNGSVVKIEKMDFVLE